MTVSAKICGLKTPKTVAAAVAGGASLVGFNFYAKSPRSVDPATVKRLAADVPTTVRTVGVIVDENDARIAEILGACELDLLQLHGHETPERVAQIRARFGKQVIKAIPVSDAADLERAAAYEDVADYLMFDAKPPKSMANALPGGNALSFDWTLLAGRRLQRPWLLAGGLTPDNLIEAVRISGAPMVDVSSGVEDRPGEKNISKIKAFLDASRRI
ncbi:phosphoribosylanthranilate isomerase [Dongia deserti]|uniref:phosphoribosylanthranilate isomerase n=1 Tax=Dongia deserti TaxID=2268030 RepID=UPI000E655BBF|nr:phosphoribosylanthranilate isomerase [Dongia deserti]